MIYALTPAEYYDRLYQPGTHVVLLHIGDDLYEDAVGPYRRVAQHLERPYRSFWVCRIRSADDGAQVQACRFPQYRLFHDGEEKAQHTGVLDDEQLVLLIEDQS